MADSQASLALNVSFIQQRIEPLCKQVPNLSSLKRLTTDNIQANTQDEWHRPLLTGEMPAFLQYTSGSTSQPKGVIVSHGNLMHNEQLIQQAFDQTEASIIVGWLPLYHDMGLIGNLLQTLYVGARCVLMSPAAFLQSPFSWLQAISVAIEHSSATAFIHWADDAFTQEDLRSVLFSTSICFDLRFLKCSSH